MTLTAPPRENLAGRLATAMSRAGCAGAVAGIWADTQREVAAAGLADWETGQTLATSTRLPVASVTKPIVATAAVRVWRARGLSLDAPLVDLLPDLAADWRASRRLSLRHLLSQTSGLQPEIPPATIARYAYAGGGLTRAARDTVQGGQSQRVGSSWRYCNPGFALAGHALGIVAGIGLDAALRQYVLEPAGMADTSFGGAQASGHAGASPVRGPYPRALRPAGGIVTTVDDLLSFAQFACTDESLAETGAPTAATTIGGRYGLGWILGHGGRARWHIGDWGGFHSCLLVVPDRRFAVAVVGNDDAAVALRKDLVWAEAARLTGVRRPGPLRHVYSGWSWTRLAAARAVAPLTRRT